MQIANISLPNGSTIYVNPADERGQRLAEASGSFNPEALSMWEQLLAEDDWTHILDIGCNYGEMLLNVNLPSTAKVLAIEPNPQILPYLKLTLSRLKDVNLTLHEVAISDREGEADFFMDTAWSGTSKLVSSDPMNPCTGNLRVPVTTIDQLLSMTRDEMRRAKFLIKIDIEGLEVTALKGALRTLTFAGKIAVMLELAHIPPKHRAWIRKNFSAYGLDMSQQRLQPLRTLDEETLQAEGFFPSDIVLRDPTISRWQEQTSQFVRGAIKSYKSHKQHWKQECRKMLGQWSGRKRAA